MQIKVVRSLCNDEHEFVSVDHVMPANKIKFWWKSFHIFIPLFVVFVEGKV